MKRSSSQMVQIFLGYIWSVHVGLLFYIQLRYFMSDSKRTVLCACSQMYHRSLCRFLSMHYIRCDHSNLFSHWLRKRCYINRGLLNLICDCALVHYFLFPRLKLFIFIIIVFNLNNKGPDKNQEDFLSYDLEIKDEQQKMYNGLYCDFF